MKKHWEQSGFLPSPSCSSQHALLFISVNFVLLKWQLSTACSAVVNKLSTLFGFAVHCKTRDFNISLDELLFIQVFKGNLQPSLERLLIVKCSHFSVSGGLSQPKNLKPNSLKTLGPWPLVFSNNSMLLLKTVAADLSENNPDIWYFGPHFSNIGYWGCPKEATNAMLDYSIAEK